VYTDDDEWKKFKSKEKVVEEKVGKKDKPLKEKKSKKSEKKGN
jgi:hypothetical protein